MVGRMRGDIGCARSSQRSFVRDHGRRSGRAALQIISGEDEAALTALSVARDMPPDAGAEPLVVDVGGGSTEFIWRDQAVSVEIGSVRLTEMFVDDVEALRAYTREALHAVARPSEPFALTGVAATVTSLADDAIAQRTKRRARITASLSREEVEAA